MVKMGEESSDYKSRLVTEICSISSAYASCIHRRLPSKKPVFEDWYLLLQVREDAEIDAIRKRYRQLALQLHPDKNSHPKAEVAFKLVSEAYGCLSNEAKRSAFNTERLNRFCKECNRKFQYQSYNFPNNLGTEKLKEFHQRVPTRSHKVMQALKEVRNRFKEESKVVENCLRARESSRKEFPVFNPSDYVLSPDYPHHRTRTLNTPKTLWYLHMGSVRNCKDRRGTCESPVFEIRS